MITCVTVMENYRHINVDKDCWYFYAVAKARLASALHSFITPTYMCMVCKLI